ncbi:MAG: hydantoinase/oxoprolinase family protein [Gammaproteobacteria bacterium]|nr:hydantoinase/oxoprolinase family protein [Pseudomonadales bacterium]MCP5347604.1 hydantoinase/oxoprolinase family protein [Pseudomonadales bacterium]
MTDSSNEEALLGIDAGGTFTDFVLWRKHRDGNRLTVHKVLSTPAAPEQAILQGIRELGVEELARTGRLPVIHGSTVATNAALEGRSARTALVTNYGFADLLTLGRQTRPSLYELEFPLRQVPVERELCIETGGRLAADGTVLEPLSGSEIRELQARIRVLQPEAVAINLLFSFLDDRFEKQLETAIREVAPEAFVCRSSAVLPEYREYERGMATWLNASLGPIVNRYLRRLQAGLGKGLLTIMQSSGETISAGIAADRAVNLLLSGPAAGLTALQYLGEQLETTRLISFDMGGTSTDVALLDGELKTTSEGQIAGFPVAVPMVDMHTIGAGGGSIAFLDSGGMLQVGPRSAGADPGPACYGRGGDQVTVTDANLVLGRIPAGAALAGSFRLDPDAARRALAPLAVRAGLDELETARGIIRVANEHMASALRMISVQRGYDPAAFVLTCFGGAGGLHVCALADAMGMTRAIVPLNAGVLSAMGMLVAPRGRQFSHTVRLLVDRVSDAEIDEALRELIDNGIRELESEGLQREALRSQASLDLCYQGQSSTLNLPWLGRGETVVRFHRLHRERYGFALSRDVELVNLRARIFLPRHQLELEHRKKASVMNNFPCQEVSEGNDCLPVIARESLTTGTLIRGPAIITELSATTFLEKNWNAALDEFGNLRLDRTDSTFDRSTVGGRPRY